VYLLANIKDNPIAGDNTSRQSLVVHDHLYFSLENTTQKINRDIAVHILIDRLPDCYKSEGQAAKQQNLPFVDTAAYLLANIKDNSITGALVVHDHQSPRRARDRNRYNHSSIFSLLPFSFFQPWPRAHHGHDFISTLTTTSIMVALDQTAKMFILGISLATGGGS
jgi:hypothetical protein